MNPRTLLAAALFLALAPAAASAQTEGAPTRTATVIVYGNDRCPVANGDEIVVCSRRPENERYRIPKELRRNLPHRPSEVSWGSRVDQLDDAARDQRPNSCSTVGTGGQTGCFQQRIRQWAAERRARR
jgi:hypothetical protein